MNLSGVIAGKALYERKFTVAEGQAALDRRLPPSDPQRRAGAALRRRRTE